MTDNTERFARATGLAAAGRPAEAAALFREILDTQPMHLAAAKALAEIVESGGVDGDAESARRRVRTIEAESTYTVGRTALVHGRFDVAIRCYRKVLEIDPDYDEAILGLAEAFYGSDDVAASLDWYRAYLRKRPGDPEATHMVAALGDGPKPPRASDAYIRDTFDHFADHFDRQLLEDLEYKAPRLLADLFRKVRPGARDLDILDAGCGTGLAGAEFRPLARFLAGVDLSPEMLKRADERRLYDELAEGELSAFLTDRPAAFDLIVAADVFCYTGDLSATLSAGARALRPGGCLAFSLERQDAGGYVLTGSGRYAHHPDYVRDCADAAGLSELVAETAQLRLEYGEPVVGHVTVLERAEG